MEYVSGISLFELIQAAGNLRNAEIYWLIDEIYKGLKDLNQSNLVHGDLHPRNVLVSVHGDVKLIDYGLANCSRGQEKFTPQFCAPEVLEFGGYSHFADLFSLAKLAEFCGASPDDFPNLVHRDPKLRVYKPKSLNSRAKGLIALRVQNYLGGGEKIETIALRRSRNYWPQFKLWYGVVAVCSLFFLTSSFALAPQVKMPPARLSVKTKIWTNIIDNNKSICRSPCEKVSLAPGSHIFHWSTAHKKGVLALTLTSGENKVLTDSDFTTEVNFERHSSRHSGNRARTN